MKKKIDVWIVNIVDLSTGRRLSPMVMFDPLTDEQIGNCLSKKFPGKMVEFSVSQSDVIEEDD